MCDILSMGVCVQCKEVIDKYEVYVVYPATSVPTSKFHVQCYNEFDHHRMQILTDRQVPTNMEAFERKHLPDRSYSRRDLLVLSISIISLALFIIHVGPHG